jgi:hypothetical protein
MCDQQRSAGITVRIFDASALTPARTLLLPDIAIFDDEVCYELTSGPRLGTADIPYFVKTLLLVRPQAVQNRIQRFDDYWKLSQRYE